MKEYTAEKIRNIGLVSHGSVGKTALAEAILFSAGVTNRLGTIDDGTTVSDYNQDEIDRKISINTSLLHCDWKNHKINIVDTPGYTDFVGEVKSALRVVDTAMILLNAVSGVEVGTEIVYRIVDEYKLPRIFFVNRMDKEHTNFNNTIDMAQKQFGNSVVVVQFPVNEGDGFDSIVDITKMKMFKFESNKSGKYTETEIPNDLKSKAEELRTSLMEKIAENDEELLDIFCDTGELTDEQFISGFKNQVANCNLFPVLCGSAVNNVGVQSMLQFIINVSPSPLERQEIEGLKPGTSDKITRDAKSEAPFSALVFKTVSEPHVGELSFFRVFSGLLKSGTEVANFAKLCFIVLKKDLK